jgi:ubiquitin C-terminal hydrolase
MDNQKYAGKGLTGLANLGNTCFMNTCVQLLSHTPCFTELVEEKFDGVLKIKNRVDYDLFNQWNELRKVIWSKNCTVSPGAWISAVQKTARIKDRDVFTGFAQNDMNECLLFIMDTFHNALSRKVKMTVKGKPDNTTDELAVKSYEMIKQMYETDYSELLPMFYGIHVSLITDIQSQPGSPSSPLSVRPEPYFVLEVPIADHLNKVTQKTSLLACFDAYTARETLAGEEQWYNDATQRYQDVHKQIKFWNFPDVLVVSLKRFDNRNRKINKLVEFPLTNLDLSRFVEGYNKESYVYDLYGVGNHTGGSMGGHYFAYVRNANGKWYIFNDTQVAEIPETKIVSPRAYLLFYHKKSLY